MAHDIVSRVQTFLRVTRCSQKAFADAAGLEPAHLHRILNRQAGKLHRDTQERLANALDARTAELATHFSATSNPDAGKLIDLIYDKSRRDFEHSTVSSVSQVLQ